ncbi:MFS transporter [Halobacteriales archaeon QS_8_69_26]|nr:MAG: MFS transporter [Halobacteriales archaeon QS_8_69_26]
MLETPRTWVRDLDLYYGWVVTGACFALVLAVFGISFSFSVFYDYLLADLGRSRSETSLVFSVQTMTLYVSSALIGGMVDRYSIRRATMVGTVLLGVGLAGASQSGTLPELLVSYGLVAGVGMGIVYVVGYTTVQRWFHRRRGVATAIATSGLGVATLVVPHVASYLIRELGWQTAYLFIMAGALAVLASAAVFLADDPVSFGVDPTQEFPEGYLAGSDRRTVREQVAEVLSVVRSRAFVSVFLNLVLTYTSLYVVLVHMVVYTKDVGLGRDVGVWTVSLSGAAAIPGRIALGYVSDRLDRLTTYVALSVGMGVLVMSLSVASTALSLYAFGLIYGFVYGGGAGLVPTLVADLFGVDNISAFYGTAAVGLGVASVLGPFLAGTSYETLGTYTPVFLGSGALAFVGAALAATWRSG